MCLGPEIAAVAAAIPEITAAAAPEAMAAAVPELAAAAVPEGLMSAGLLNSAPGVLAPGMEAAGTLDSMLINNGMSSMAGGGMTKGIGGLLGGANNKGMGMAMQGMQMMQPQQQPQQPMGMMPQQPQKESLPLPYGQSQGPYPMSEEQKRKLRMMGIQV